jgi:ubiquinone/menaquinone biosynthesis C-methylase UbiE
MFSRRGFICASAVPFLRGQETKPSMFANAEAYERFMGRWSRLLAPLLIEFTGLPDGGKVLDVGSGTGSLAFAIAGSRPRTHVVGIEPSEAFVAYSKSRNSFPDRVEFQVGDAQQMALPDASFDASLALLVFNFIPGRMKALREVRRTTKPGGLISAVVWDYSGRMQMLRTFFNAATKTNPKAAEQIDEKSMPLSRAGELAVLWKQGGLDNIKEQPLEITMRFKSFSDYWDPFLLGQGPAGAYVRSLDAGQLQALRSEVKRQLSWEPEDKPLDLLARAWAVRGAVPQAG